MTFNIRLSAMMDSDYEKNRCILASSSSLTGKMEA